MCFGCGPDNAVGLQLEFTNRPDGRLETSFVPRAHHTGWEGILHGGLMATLLDEAIMAYLYRNGVNAATAELNVRYLAPVKLGEEIVVQAWEETRRGRLFRMAAEARTSGAVVARASASCLVTDGEER